MRKHLPMWLTALSALLFHVSQAQVTLVSSGTNLTSGFVLPNGTPLLFSEETGALYTTNGTAATVITNNVVYNSDEGSAALYKGQLYFTGTSTANDVELWATDGTAANTRLIKNIAATGSSNPDDFFVFNNLLYFTANDGASGRELWVSDGSTGNASLVSNINGTAAGSISGDNAVFVQNGGNVFFEAASGGKRGLYKLTSSGVSLVKNDFFGTLNLLPGITTASIGNKLVFTVDSSEFIVDPGTGDFTSKTTMGIWATDGTTAGTTALHTFVSSDLPSGFTTPVLFKNELYFVYSDTATSALWRTDGTAANTQLFKNFDVDKSQSQFNSGLLSSVIINNKLFFTAFSNEAGNELWSTDGTPAGTALFKDINPGPNGSGAFFVLNTGAFADNFFNGNAGNNFTYQQFFTPFKGRYYFTANDGAHGSELWSTDGNSNNTTYVKDINPNQGDGVEDGGFSDAYYTSTGIFFTADNGSTGTEPWVTDGTAAGTSLVQDINTNDDDGSDPQYLFIYKSQLYLNAGDGGENTNLYKVDATTGALPVRLLSFAAQKQPQSVLLTWTTTNEINASSFAIERSVDGVHFSGIGTLPAGSSNAVNKEYGFDDVSALQAGSSRLYYRLKMVDIDGRYAYSAILLVQLENGVFTVKLSPNPVRSQLTVSFSAGTTSRATLRVTDAGGRQLFQQVYTSVSGASIQQTIDASRFAKGMYYVQLVTDRETRTLKFIKD